jgi:large subunit ribosomal protein L18
MCVYRSHQNIACQLVDDVEGRTLVSASSQEKPLRDELKYGGNKEAAQVIGKTIAERALAAGIEGVRFDRGACKYHGRVAALADAAREAGLRF